MSTITLTVFTAPGCAPCDCTKRHIEKLHLTARFIDVSAAPDAAEFLRREGFAALPVVFPSDPHVKPWAGFRPGLLDKLVKVVAV